MPGPGGSEGGGANYVKKCHIMLVSTKGKRLWGKLGEKREDRKVPEDQVLW